MSVAYHSETNDGLVERSRHDNTTTSKYVHKQNVPRGEMFRGEYVMRGMCQRGMAEGV